jgi:allophanate hydrolase
VRPPVPPEQGAEPGPELVDLVVFGAHLSGQPLNDDLRRRGATLVGPAQTSANYRLWALDTAPPKPGLLRVQSDGAAVRGEHWRLPVAAFGTFVATLAAPMTVGSVELEDGRVLPGFLVEPFAVEGVPDITAYGGWVAYLEDDAVKPWLRQPSLDCS